MFHLTDLAINPLSCGNCHWNFIWIPLILQFENIFAQQNRYFSVIFLSLKTCFINKFNQPLHNRKDIVNIKPLKLERLQYIWTLHVNQCITNIFRHFNFLSNLHLIVILDFDLKIRWCNAPSNTTDHFIKSFKRSNTNSEISR